MNEKPSERLRMGISTDRAGTTDAILDEHHEWLGKLEKTALKAEFDAVQAELERDAALARAEKAGASEKHAREMLKDAEALRTDAESRLEKAEAERDEANKAFSGLAARYIMKGAALGKLRQSVESFIGKWLAHGELDGNEVNEARAALKRILEGVETEQVVGAAEKHRQAHDDFKTRLEAAERRADDYQQRFEALRRDVEATANGWVRLGTEASWARVAVLDLLARHPMPEEKSLPHDRLWLWGRVHTMSIEDGLLWVTDEKGVREYRTFGQVRSLAAEYEAWAPAADYLDRHPMPEEPKQPKEPGNNKPSRFSGYPPFDQPPERAAPTPGPQYPRATCEECEGTGTYYSAGLTPFKCRKCMKPRPSYVPADAPFCWSVDGLGDDVGMWVEGNCVRIYNPAAPGSLWWWTPHHPRWADNGDRLSARLWDDANGLWQKARET